MTGRRANSISSCNYSSYASALLNTFNPQDRDTGSAASQKCLKTASITYAKAAAQLPSQPPLQASLSTLMDIDKLYDSMSLRFGEQFGSKVSINALNNKWKKRPRK
jgi:hypothetical protein